MTSLDSPGEAFYVEGVLDIQIKDMGGDLLFHLRRWGLELVVQLVRAG